MRKSKTTIAAAVIAALTGAVPVEAQWTTGNMDDRMGRRSDDVYAISGYSGPHRRLDRTYATLRARLRVNCGKMALIFDLTSRSVQANLAYGTRVDIQVDGGRIFSSTYSEWNHMASLRNEPPNGELMRQLRDGNRVSVAVDWYGQGRVRFDFSLSGSSHAILASCADGMSIAEYEAEQDRVRSAREERNRLVEERRAEQSRLAAERYAARERADREREARDRRDRWVGWFTSAAASQLRMERSNRVRENCGHLDREPDQVYDECRRATLSVIGANPSDEEVRTRAEALARRQANAMMFRW